MPNQWSYFPSVITSNDLRSLRIALQHACAISHVTDEADVDLLARSVFEYYQRGLTEPKRLAELACFICRLGEPREASKAALSATARSDHVAAFSTSSVTQHKPGVGRT